MCLLFTGIQAMRNMNLLHIGWQGYEQAYLGILMGMQAMDFDFMWTEFVHLSFCS